MRRGTTIALGTILVALFGALILQLVVLGHQPSCREGTVTTTENPSAYVLPEPKRGLADLDGRTVTGCSVHIQSVAGSGFWIGQDENRVFVVASASFTPRSGDKIDLTGTLEVAGQEQLAGLSVDDRLLLQMEVDYVAAGPVTPHG